MKKIKLLVSICIVALLSGAIIHEYSKIQADNEAKIAQSINEEKALAEAIAKNEEIVKEKEKTKIDNRVSEKVVPEAVEPNVQESVKEEQSQVAKNHVAEKETVEVQESVKIPMHQSPVIFEEVPSRGDEPSVGGSATNNNESNSYIAEIEQAIFIRVNEERTANGLAPLSYNNTMESYGRIKSKDMGDRSYFDHANPEGELITAQMKRDGVSYNAWGENIAYIQGDYNNSSLANQFMANWMNSQGHRENILSSNFTSIGVGVYKIGNTYYATQEFHR